MSDLVDRFRALADEIGKPDLDEDLDTALWILASAEDHLEIHEMTATEIARVMREVLKANVSWQRVVGLLDADPSLTIKKKRRGRQPSLYTITARGRERLSSASDEAIFVQPETGFSGVRQVESMFSKLSGEIRVCDPYFAPRSMDFLAKMSQAASLSVLTKNITDRDKVESELKLLRKELGINIQIRVAQGRELHDRYVIDDESMIVLGTSLNGLGKRQTIVVEVGEDLRAITLSAFERLFKAATSI